MESTTGYTFTPGCGIFYFPWHRHQIEEVGYVDMWDSFVGNEELYFRDGLHLSGKGAAVLAEGLSGAVASGLGKVRYLN